MLKIHGAAKTGLIAALMLALLINAGAVSADEEEKVNDPLEPLNRITSSFNRIFRTVIADPVISGYQAVTPEPMQRGIANFASNLTEPVTAFSSLLQGDSENAGNAMGRFFINTTVGMGGLSDQASKMGMEQRREDLGQAAGAAGAGGGAHIVLPFFGPSNMRDATGDILTSLVNPLHTVTTAVNAGTSYAENRDQLKAMTDTAIDPYIVERDAYEQNRQYRIDNGQTKLSDIPDFDDDEEEPAN